MPGRLFYKVLSHCPTSPPPWWGSLASCWHGGLLAGREPGPPGAQQHPAAGRWPHGTLRRKGGFCPDVKSRSSFDWQIGFSNALLPTACLLSSLKTEPQDVCAEPAFRHATFLTGADSRTKVFRSDRFTCLSTTLHWWPGPQRVKSGHLAQHPGPSEICPTPFPSLFSCTGLCASPPKPLCSAEPAHLSSQRASHRMGALGLGLYLFYSL